MNATALRDATKTSVESLGYLFNENLPILDSVHVTHNQSEVVGRILSLYVCVACSYGFSKDQAMVWLEREELTDFLTASEVAFVNGEGHGQQTRIQWQVEALWALTWACGYHDDLDFGKPCPDSFIGLFPDLKNGETSEDFRWRCKIRSTEEISQNLDLNYCLHWAVRNSQLRAAKSPISEQVEARVIEERRRALEWLVSDEDWDEVSLDT